MTTFERDMGRERIRINLLALLHEAIRLGELPEDAYEGTAARIESETGAVLQLVLVAMTTTTREAA